MGAKLSVFLVVSTVFDIYDLAFGDALSRVVALVFLPFLVLGWLKASRPKRRERDRVSYRY